MQVYESPGQVLMEQKVKKKKQIRRQSQEETRSKRSPSQELAQNRRTPLLWRYDRDDSPSTMNPPSLTSPPCWAKLYMYTLPTYHSHKMALCRDRESSFLLSSTLVKRGVFDPATVEAIACTEALASWKIFISNILSSHLTQNKLLRTSSTMAKVNMGLSLVRSLLEHLYFSVISFLKVVLLIMKHIV